MSRPNPEVVPSAILNYSRNESGGVSNTTMHYNVSYREHNSRPTPAYATLKRLKLLPQNGYQSTSYKISTDRYSFTNSYRYDGRFHSSGATSVWHSYGALPLALQPPTLVTEARNGAYRKMAQQCSAVKVNLAQFLGERKQTANMIATTVERIAKAAFALKHADLGAFTQALALSGPLTRKAFLNKKQIEATPSWKRIPNFWLEYIYGWKPLLSDLYQSGELCAKAVVENSNDWGSSKSSGTIRVSKTVTRTVAEPGVRGGNSHVVFDRFSSHSVKVKAVAAYALQNDAVAVLAQTGITNPALLVWELLPYSFVVDWFLPVGNYLESLSDFDGFDLKAGYVSTLERSGMTLEASYYSKPDGYDDPYVSSFVGGSASATQHRYTFTPDGSLSYSPVLKSPIGGEPLSRFATAASLLCNAFGTPNRINVKHLR